jgi:hypothetical protein
MTTQQAIQTNANISYIEPGDDGITPVTITVSAWEAIALTAPSYARANLKLRTNGQDILQPTFEQMLDDYLVVHWATIQPFSRG